MTAVVYGPISARGTLTRSEIETSVIDLVEEETRRIGRELLHTAEQYRIPEERLGPEQVVKEHCKPDPDDRSCYLVTEAADPEWKWLTIIVTRYARRPEDPT